MTIFETIFLWFWRSASLVCNPQQDNLGRFAFSPIIVQKIARARQVDAITIFFDIDVQLHMYLSMLLCSHFPLYSILISKTYVIYEIIRIHLLLAHFNQSNIKNNVNIVHSFILLRFILVDHSENPISDGFLPFSRFLI